MRLNSTSVNIKWILFLLALSSCYQHTELKEVTAKRVSEQEMFISKLKVNRLIATDSIDELSDAIRSVVQRSKFNDRYRINQTFDSTFLNFYIIDSRKDTTLHGLCAYAGNNVIFLDRQFLNDFIPYPKVISYKSRDNLNRYFQSWVIGHEVAHADLGHVKGHFISSIKPKKQEEARAFHSVELVADKQSGVYLEDVDNSSIDEMLTIVFNKEYEKLYGTYAASTHSYLKMDPDPFLTIPYKLDGSHPTFCIRAAAFLYLRTKNPALKKESYLFLMQSQLHYLQEMIEIPSDSILKKSLLRSAIN